LKSYPALDVWSDSADLVQVIVDDFEPTAVEERDHIIRVFFTSAAARDSARVALSPSFHVVPIELPDDDWARRSQQNIHSVRIGNVVVAPPWAQRPAASPASATSRPPATDCQPATSRQPPVSIVILPSMGFGTGHHATTRLCLAALQTIDLAGAFVLDVGTGSGVLALAAARLGAVRAVGIDTDQDAIQSARENLALNPDIRGIAFEVADLTSSSLPPADVVTANLTGALLIRAADALRRTVRPGGSLIASGLLASERGTVMAAFAGMTPAWESAEDEWVGLAFRGTAQPAVLQAGRAERAGRER
jgi:ribosomal protein L11 methyltransferase